MRREKRSDDTREAAEHSGWKEASLSQGGALYDFAPTAYFVFDIEGDICEVNHAGATLLKTECSYLRNKPFAVFLSQEYQTGFFDHLHRVFQTGHRQITEARIDSPGQGQVWVRIESRRRPDAPEQCLSVMTDMTDRKRIEDDLILAREKALADNRAKNTFLASISHEIRTPMGGILSMSELVLGTKLTEEQRRYLKAIHSSTESLLSVVDELLDVSRLEADHVSLSRDPFYLRDLVSTVIALFEPTAARKGIQLETSMDDDVRTLFRGDRNRIRQVLINLVSNAIRFTEKGSVTLRVREEELSAFLREITFEVADTGPGIEPAEQQRIHSLFRQALEDETQWYSDQRLGLAISRKLARLMGGQLYFETSPTAGTRFFFSIPLEVSTEEDTTEADAPVTSGTDHAVAGRILVAEDNKINVLVIRTILEKQGYQVTTVHTGQEAITALEHGSFDLVLMDISMPVMDGMTATRAIRGRRTDDRFDPDVPVIAISAHSMKGDRERFLDAGMNDYISKPFEQDTVIEVIRRNMRSRG